MSNGRRMSSDRVRITEVGPRDGLQNEKRVLPTAQKLKFIEALAAAGLQDIELGSLVRPDKVPQMADSETIAAKWGRKSKLRRAWVLVPNSKGLDRAIATRVRDIAVFTAVSETFNRKNIGLSVSESLA